MTFFREIKPKPETKPSGALVAALTVYAVDRWEAERAAALALGDDPDAWDAPHPQWIARDRATFGINSVSWIDWQRAVILEADSRAIASMLPLAVGDDVAELGFGCVKRSGTIQVIEGAFAFVQFTNNIDTEAVRLSEIVPPTWRINGRR